MVFSNVTRSCTEVKKESHGDISLRLSETNSLMLCLTISIAGAAGSGNRCGTDVVSDPAGSRACNVHQFYNRGYRYTPSGTHPWYAVLHFYPAGFYQVGSGLRS